MIYLIYMFVIATFFTMMNNIDDDYLPTFQR